MRLSLPAGLLAGLVLLTAGTYPGRAEEPQDNIARLIQKLVSPDPAQRVQAAKDLGALGEKAGQAVRPLCAAVLDKAGPVPDAALDALSRIRPDIHRQMLALLTAIASPKPSPVQLGDVQARWVPVGNAGKTAELSFLIHNVGNKSILRLQVTVSFLDRSGKVIHQETVEPVNSSLVYAQEKRRLEPGQKRFVRFRAKECPDGWREGKVALDVTGIDVAD